MREVNQIAAEKKELGTQSFRLGDLQDAEKLYEQAANIFQTTGGEWPEGEELNQRRITETAALLNLALVKIRLEKYAESIAACTRVLAVEKNSVKALYRRALASFKFGEYEKAKKDALRAAVLDPQNREVRGLLEEIKQNLAVSVIKERELYKKM